MGSGSMREESANGGLAPDQIRPALDRVIGSSVFTASPRMQGFLRYVVEETLAGRGDEIKGYTLALEVFGRGGSFDPANDSVVRVEAARLRRTLAAYYGDEGIGDPIAIDVPKGGYVPIFRSREAPTVSPHSGAPPVHEKPAVAAAVEPRRRDWRRFAVAAAVILLLVAAGAAFSLRQPQPQTEAEEPAGAPPAELARPARPTIAVLPFVAAFG